MTRVIVALVLAAACVLGGASVVPQKEKAQGDLWAVLVAGSYTWMNYRHQVSLWLISERQVNSPWFQVLNFDGSQLFLKNNSLYGLLRATMM